MRWNYYKLRKLSLLHSAMDSYYKLRQLFYYKVRHGLLQVATGITKCDDYYKLRQSVNRQFLEQIIFVVVLGTHPLVLRRL